MAQDTSIQGYCKNGSKLAVDYQKEDWVEVNSQYFNCYISGKRFIKPSYALAKECTPLQLFAKCQNVFKIPDKNDRYMYFR